MKRIRSQQLAETTQHSSDYGCPKSGAGPIEVGHVTVSSGTMDRVPYADINKAISRHQAGDWSNLCDADRHENERALQSGGRLFTIHDSDDGTRFWIITDPCRTKTTVLLPLEY